MPSSPGRSLLELRPRRLLLAAAVAAVQLLGSLGASRGAGIAAPSGTPGPDPGGPPWAWWRHGGWPGWAAWQADRDPVDGWAVALLLAGPLALLLARRRPSAPAALLATTVVLATTVGAAAVYVAAGYVLGPVLLSPAIALVETVAAGRRRLAWAAAALGWATAMLGSAAGPHPVPLASGLGFVVWVVAVLAVADVVRGRRERAAVEARARAEERRREAGDERLRIARDLHDGVAHHISLISVRAGVAAHLLDAGDPSAPAEAREALGTIRRASTEALAELRSALGALRADEEPAPRHPVPGLVDGAEALVRSWSGAGLEVSVTDLPAALPPPLDRAAYRMVQEALTNVSRHSGAAQAAVRWRDEGDRAVLTVTDPGPRRGRDATEPAGRGLPGMRERVEQLGGTLTAGPAGTGWRVSAVLPLPVRPQGQEDV